MSMLDGVHLDLSDVRTPHQLIHGSEVLRDGVADILKRLFFRSPLRPAAGQPWAGDAIAFLRLL